MLGHGFLHDFESADNFTESHLQRPGSVRGHAGGQHRVGEHGVGEHGIGEHERERLGERDRGRCADDRRGRDEWLWQRERDGDQRGEQHE